MHANVAYIVAKRCGDKRLQWLKADMTVSSPLPPSLLSNTVFITQSVMYINL